MVTDAGSGGFLCRCCRFVKKILTALSKGVNIYIVAGEHITE